MYRSKSNSRYRTIILLLFLFAMPCYANIFECVIKENGGDYNSLSTWESAIDSNLISTRTLVFYFSSITGTMIDNATLTGLTSLATGTLLHATTYYMALKNINGIFQSGETVYRTLSVNFVVLSDSGNPFSAYANIQSSWTNVDSSAVDINGWTTGISNFIKIYTSNSARHSGVWNDTTYRLVNSVGYGSITFTEENIIIDGLQFRNASTVEGACVYDVDTVENPPCNFTVSNCILRHEGEPSANSRGIFFRGNGSAGIWKVYNNVLQHLNPAIIDFGPATNGSTFYIYNNTISSGIFNAFSDGFNAKDVIYLKNNISTVKGTCYPSWTAIIKSTHNLSLDATSPDTAYRSLYPTFISDTTDFGLVNTDTSSYNNGWSLNPDYSGGPDITTDIANVLRKSTPDIGSREIAAITSIVVKKKRIGSYIQ